MRNLIQGAVYHHKKQSGKESKESAQDKLPAEQNLDYIAKIHMQADDVAAAQKNNRENSGCGKYNCQNNYFKHILYNLNF
jgi:hypothetical protein